MIQFTGSVTFSIPSWIPCLCDCPVVGGDVALDFWRDQDFGKGFGRSPVAGSRRCKLCNLPIHWLHRDTGKEDVVIDERVLGRLEIFLVGD